MLPIRKLILSVGLLAAAFACFVPARTAWAQTAQQAARISVAGKVVDETGEPLMGASVFVKGTNNGTVTDLDGQYSLSVPAGSVLEVSFMGYETQNVTVSTSGRVDVVLQPDSDYLNEVVVVGYGIQKKVDLSGSVSVVNGDQITSRPAPDALSAIQGAMPGVQVLRSSGEPGSETSGIRVRGFSSANSTSTLVLIDGVEGDMTLLNPNDIESISVLKDAAAAAIYGARAAAGVVLVTTKSGANSGGKATVTYNGYYAFNVPTVLPERLPTWEEQEMINISRFNQGGKVEWNPEQSYWTSNANFNYRKNPNGRWDLFSAENWILDGTKRFTTQQQHSVSVSGGSDKVNYYVSGSYYDKDGILKYGPDSNQRYNLRAKFSAQVNKYIDLGVQASYDGKFIETNPYGTRNILERLYRIRSRQPIYAPEEDPNENPYNGDLQVNPIDIMENGGLNKNQYHSIMGRGNVRIKNLVKGLSFDLAASRKYGFYNQRVERHFLLWNGWNGAKRFDANNPNSFSRTMNNDYHDNIEAIVRYDLTAGKHSFNAMAGYSFEQYRKEQMSTEVKNLNSNTFYSLNYYASDVAANTSVKDDVQTWAMMSMFGRLNYNYAERYLFEANIRYDGSSRLAPESRWHAFPSFSAAWRISNEEWFGKGVVSNLKLRASWGQLGNGAILGLYDYIPLIDSGADMGVKNYYQSEMASKSKTWEVISSTNFGIDLGMFENRLTLTADIYQKVNDNMLASLELPHVVGITVPSANVGTLKTKGWEFEIGWRDQIGDFGYNLGFNLSDANSVLVKYDGRSTVGEGVVSLLEGYPMNTIWGYKTDGYWSSREEYTDYKAAHPGYQSFGDANITGGDIKYVAQGEPNHTIGAGNGVPGDSGDLVQLGDCNSHYLYAFNLGLNWKGIDFSAMIQGVGRRNVLIETKTIAPFAQSSNMPWTIHRDYWTEDNQNAFWPRLYHYNNGEIFNFHASDRWIQDASYIRLKNIQLGYTLPIKKAVRKMRVYVSGQDVWFHSKMLGVFDPEVGNTATASVYPFFGTWSLGLNLTF